MGSARRDSSRRRVSLRRRLGSFEIGFSSFESLQCTQNRVLSHACTLSRSWNPAATGKSGLDPVDGIVESVSPQKTLERRGAGLEFLERRPTSRHTGLYMPGGPSKTRHHADDAPRLLDTDDVCWGPPCPCSGTDCRLGVAHEEASSMWRLNTALRPGAGPADHG